MGLWMACCSGDEVADSMSGRQDWEILIGGLNFEQEERLSMQLYGTTNRSSRASKRHETTSLWTRFPFQINICFSGVLVSQFCLCLSKPPQVDTLIRPKLWALIHRSVAIGGAHSHRAPFSNGGRRWFAKLSLPGQDPAS